MGQEMKLLEDESQRTIADIRQVVVIELFNRCSVDR